MAVDFDSPWKEALHYFLPLFLQLHFPDIAADIDWSRPYEALDTELAEIAPTDASGRWVDKLFKVFLKDGSEQWVLIHVEVQSQRDPEFPERMFEYFYRIRDKFGRAPCSLAVLADDSPTWRPNTYEVARWGCKLRLEFPVVKLLDFASQLEELEASDNPFALVVAAHLRAQQTARDDGARYAAKFGLLRNLRRRNLPAEEVRQFMRVLDWLLQLPPALREQLRYDVRASEGEQPMPFVSVFEEWALEEAEKKVEQRLEQKYEQKYEQKLEQKLQEQKQALLQAAQQAAQQAEEATRKALREGLELALELKFGDAGLQLVPALRAVQDITTLQSLKAAIRNAQSPDDLRPLLPEPT